MENVINFVERKTIEAEARQWLIRLDGDGELSPEDKAALQAWIQRSPSHREELQRISSFWNEANILTELAIPLQPKVSEPVQPPPSLFKSILELFPFNGVTTTATVLFLSAAAIFAAWYLPKIQEASNGIYATAIGQLHMEKLTDSSVVHINTDSQVQVDYSDTVRKVRLLRGEAHFEVAKNTRRPFEVYAGNSMIKAVGTAFSVRIREDHISVIVDEGQVELALKPTLLTPSPTTSVEESTTGIHSPALKNPPLVKIGVLDQGQSATLDNQRLLSDQDHHALSVDELAQVESIAKPELDRRLSWLDGYLVFAGEPLNEVVKEVNRYTPVVIEIIDPSIRQIPIGGRFKVEDLDALYEVLETSFGIRVSRSDDQHIQLRRAQG